MSKTPDAKLSHPHDLLVRNILNDPDLAADLLKNYLPPEWVSLLDFSSIKREPTESVNRSLSELLADLRYSAKFKTGKRELKVFLFLEHQSQPDRFMSFRLLEYVFAAYRQHLAASQKEKKTTFPYPLAVVLHHGKTPWKKVTPMRDLIDIAPGATSEILQLPICLIDLAQIPVDQLHGHPVVCALLDSLQSASTGRLADRALSIFDRLRDVRQESRLKSWSMALARYYMAVQGRFHSNADDLTRIFTRLYNEKEAGKMVTTFVEKCRQEGVELGLEKGIAKGKVESVLTVLEARFGTVPASLKKKLGTLKESDRIDNALRLAGTSQSLKEFQKSL